ncbi:uncharacterized protein LOC141854629 [Brevipalpus obovatus]|uniref:uncharacterized protein LOC141854629 n=1 Tax=Brevipalpus obovatus TaxID=246614 RepID=UPI003D9EB4A9
MIVMTKMIRLIFFTLFAVMAVSALRSLEVPESKPKKQSQVPLVDQILGYDSKIQLTRNTYNPVYPKPELAEKGVTDKILYPQGPIPQKKTGLAYEIAKGQSSTGKSGDMDDVMQKIINQNQQMAQAPSYKPTTASAKPAANDDDFDPFNFQLPAIPSRS